MEFNNERSIYIQIVEIIEQNIITSKLSMGEKIPSVREYALIYKVNPNTIVKSLEILEDENLIYTQKTNGKYVTNDKTTIDKLREKLIKNKINNFIDEISHFGLNIDDVIDYLRKENK